MKTSDGEKNGTNISVSFVLLFLLEIILPEVVALEVVSSLPRAYFEVVGTSFSLG